MARAQVLILNSRGHQRKKRTFFFWIFLVLILGALGFFFLNQQSQVSVNSLRLYFYDTAKHELIPIQRDFEISGTQEKAIKTIIEQLSQPPEDKNLISLIPSYTKVKSVTFHQDVCTISFNDASVSDLANTVVRESAAVYSLVNSITEFPGIQKVKIIIEGKSDPFFKRYFSIEQALPRLTGQLMQGMNTLLYFYHYPTDTMVGEFREIPDKASLDQAALDVVNQLIIGPDQKELSSLLPQGTKVLGCKVENGICTIDFSKEVRRFSYGATEELALINLLTLSLTELKGIERVSFQVEGKEVYTLGGHISVDKPIQRWYGSISSPAKIYFMRKVQQSTGFTPLDRKLPNNQPEIIIQSLIDGTTAQEKENGVSSDLPSGIKLIKAYPNEQNELIIDLEVELSKFLNAQQEQNFIRQVVLSITENTSIQEIWFYIDGKKLEALPFGTDISRVFSRRDSFR
jgi:germination protein M